MPDFRTKVNELHNEGFSPLYLRLLLKQGRASREDIVYVDKLYEAAFGGKQYENTKKIK